MRACVDDTPCLPASPRLRSPPRSGSTGPEKLGGRRAIAASHLRAGHHRPRIIRSPSANLRRRRQDRRAQRPIQPLCRSGGAGSVIAARMAVEDAGGTVLGKPVDIVDRRPSEQARRRRLIARQWFDADKVDMAIGFDNSSVALAVEQLARTKRTESRSPAPSAPPPSPASTARRTKRPGSTTSTR